MLMISVGEVLNILEEYAVCTPDEEKSLIQRINQASMFIDNIGTVSKWISVKDRMPEPFEDVLTYDDKCKIIINWLEEIVDGIPYFAYSGKTVTHWMPLPELPKENSDGY